MVSLCEVKIGQEAEIREFFDNTAKCYSSRFGLEKGQRITCIAKPGAVVVRKKHQEIAIGNQLSKQIFVELK